MRTRELISVVVAAAAVLLPLLARAELTEADLRRMRAEKRVALVIGNGNYRDFEALDNPLNDARDVAGALSEAGFKVILRLDATREEMLSALDEFSVAMGQGEVGLFYFAGHAAQVDWRNFMVPVAAELDVDELTASDLSARVAEEAVDLAQVLERMKQAENRLNIVILDACRDNPFTAEARELGRSLSRSAGKAPFNVGVGLAQSFAPPRTFLAYSTAPGQVAADGAGSNSPYTGALVKALAVPGLKLEDVFKQVRNAVAEATAQQQIPWDNSSVFDEFYFRVPTRLATAAPRDAKGEINTTFVSP